MPAFIEISLALIGATFLGLLARTFRQPVVLAYILAGVILGPAVLNFLHTKEIIETFSTFGIAFLLFLIGVEIDFRKLRAISWTVVMIGCGQIIFTAGISYGILFLLHIPPLENLYIALAITFSSTIIVVQLLSERKALDSWHARLTVGMLLIQDLVAVFALVLLAALTPDTSQNASELLLTLSWFAIKGMLLLGAILLTSRLIFPRLFAQFARSPELLFLGSISWCLLAALAATALGFSLAIGALFAGLSLSQLQYHVEISGRVRPIRDFFLTLFFVSLGAQIQLATLSSILLPAIILSLFILIGNPLIVITIMGVMRYRKRISFLVGVTVAQISEFSLILIALGYSLGHVREQAVALVTLIAIITIPLSSYFILYAEKLYLILRPILSLFERKTPKDFRNLPETLSDHIILFGYHRMGTIIAKTLKNLHLQKVVVDFNPEIIEQLLQEKEKALYGDIKDVELLSELHCDRARMIISTIPDFSDNMSLLTFLSTHHIKTPAYVTAENANDALDLYRAGARFVIFPQYLSAKQFSGLLHATKLSTRPWSAERTKQIRELRETVEKKLPY